MNDVAHLIVPLGKITQAHLGYPFRGAVKAVREGGVAVVQIKNADPERGVNWSSVISTELAGRKRPDWLQPDDVLFAARGNRNVAILIDAVPGRAVCAPQFFLLRVKDDRVLPAYLAWYLNQLPAQRYFAQSAEGTLVTSIRRAVLEALPVPLPSFERQQLIAKLGDAFLREKRLTEKLLLNREQQLRLVAIGLME